MRQLALALVALVLLSLGLRAQGHDTVLVGPVQVVLDSLWPASMSKGYQPLRVRVTSASESHQTVELTVVMGWRENLRINRTVHVGPLETVEFELLVPAFFESLSDYRVLIEVGGERARSSAFGRLGAGDDYTHTVLVFGATAAPAGRGEAWSQELSPTKTSTTYYNSARWRNYGFNKASSWMKVASVSVGEVPFADMSTDWRAYSSLDLAIVDLAEGAPASAELDALVAWVRTGGELAFVGADVNAAVAQLEAVAPWLENRFLLEPTAAGSPVRRYQCGFGRVLVAPTDELLDSVPLRAAVLREMQSRIRTGWTPSPRGSRGRGLGIVPEIPGLGGLPFRAFIVLMILFGVLVWPVNFYFVKRKGKPVWLLLTIPAIALGASLLVLAYGFFWQGIDIQTESTTVAVLDQRSGVADNVEVRALFAGLAPGRGLVPRAGTGVFTWKDESSWGRNSVFRIEYGQGEQRYGAGFLPSRKQIQQVLISDRTTRLRVEFDADGRVTNGLGVDLEALIAHAPDGSWWRLESSVPAGESGQLEAIDAPAPDFDELPAFNASATWDLPSGTYSARTNASALRDDAGLELVELAGDHTLLGVLAVDAAFPGATQ